MNKEERTSLYGIVNDFVPNLTTNLSHQHIDDDRVMSLVGEALAMQDAEIVELRNSVQALEQSAPAALPVDPAQVTREHVAALLRHHRLMYNDVHNQAYTDELGKARTRKVMVPRPAVMDDVLNYRDTGEGIRVVLGDGTRHLLIWIEEPA